MMFLITLLFFSLFKPLNCCAHQNIDKIPLEDRLELELFFDYLMHNSMIGYTLCGDKPVSIESFPKLSKTPPRFAVNIFIKHPGYFILWKGWQTWERYSHLFPSDNFVLRFNQSTNTLVIVNKKCTRKIVEENIDLFRNHSDAPITSEMILEEI